MANQRGLPVEMLSDNDTYFAGGERELRELIEELDAEKIVASEADNGIKWNFIPTLAPHFGGVHDSMTKSAKKAIKAVAGMTKIWWQYLQEQKVYWFQNFWHNKSRRWNTINSKLLS